MKPIVIIPPDTMSAKDIKLLRENGICVVVCEEPAAVKFIDALPAVSSRTQIEDAALQLSRIVLSPGNEVMDRSELRKTFCEILLRGTNLGTQVVEPPKAEPRKR